VSPTHGPDEEQYIQIDISVPPAINGVEWGSVAILSPSQRAYPLTALFSKGESAVTVEAGTIDSDDYNGVMNLLQGGYKGASEAKPPTPSEQPVSNLFLDGAYRSIVVGDVVIIQSGAHFHAGRIIAHVEVHSLVSAVVLGMSGSSIRRTPCRTRASSPVSNSLSLSLSGLLSTIFSMGGVSFLPSANWGCFSCWFTRQDTPPSSCSRRSPPSTTSGYTSLTSRVEDVQMNCAGFNDSAWALVLAGLQSTRDGTGRRTAGAERGGR